VYAGVPLEPVAETKAAATGRTLERAFLLVDPPHVFVAVGRGGWGKGDEGTVQQGKKKKNKKR